MLLNDETFEMNKKYFASWIISIYKNKHTRQKSLKKYMKFWRSKLARLNQRFDTYIKENYKVVDYEVKKPLPRMSNLTWKPYGYYRRMRIKKARRRCIISKELYILKQCLQYDIEEEKWSSTQIHMKYS